jgi:hypothetical protein
MRKAITRRRRRAIVAMTVMAAAFSGLIASASAVTLNGDWAPFNRCPVDNPTMLAADGQTSIAFCNSNISPNGSLTIDKLTYPTGESNSQFGLISSSGFTVISPAGGAQVSAPAVLPGGLQGLVCPSDSRSARWICKRHGEGLLHAGDGRFNTVTATLMGAGELSNFNLFAGLEAMVPIVTVPVEIHLQNVLLGEHCFIGSDAEPIVLRIENLVAPSLSAESFDPDGTPDPSGAMGRFALLGATQGDSSFAVPPASGCGSKGVLDEAIDTNVGLPSPAGKNSIVMDNPAIYLTGINSPEESAPHDGEDLSKYWHSAVLPLQGGGQGHGH